MAKQTLYELALDITANSAELNKKLDQANSQIKGFAKNTENIGGQVMGAFAKMGLAVGGVAGALEFAKKAMNSTEGGADKLEFAVAGLKGGFNSLLRNLSTASFGNILSGFEETYKAAKKLAEKFDELEVFSAFSNWEIAGLKRQSSQLKEAAADMTKSKDERSAIWNQVVDIEEKIFKKTEALANKKLQLEKDNWESINKVTVKGAMDAYKTSLDMTDKQMQEMNVIYSVALSNYNHFIPNAKEVQEAIAKSRMLEKGFTQDQVDSYMTLQKLERGEKDNLILLYNFQTTAEDAKYNAQMRYNAAIMRDSRLEIQAVKDVKKEIVSLSDFVDATTYFQKYYAPDLPPEKVPGMDSYGSLVKPNNYVLPTGFSEPVGPTNDELEKQQKLVSGLTNVFQTMFSSVDDGFKGMAKAFGSMLKQMAIQLAAKAAVFGILTLISGGTGGLASLASGALKGFKWFANGTNYAPSGWAMVGEQGPELVNLSRGAQVFSNAQTSNMMGGSGNIHGELVGRGTNLLAVISNVERQNNGWR